MPQTISIILKVRWQELSIVHALEAKEGLELVRGKEADIVMLYFDPSVSVSLDLISDIRSFSSVPLIVISRSNDVVDRVRALEIGADDWICRSSEPMEFIAKINAIMRRYYRGSVNNVSSFLDGRLTINYATHEVRVAGELVKLSPIEYKILCQLARNEGCLVSHENLLLHAWGPNYEADAEFLKKYIHRLRTKIEQDPANPRTIHCERGVGYILTTSSNSTA